MESKKKIDKSSLGDGYLHQRIDEESAEEDDDLLINARLKQERAMDRLKAKGGSSITQRVFD